VKLERQPGETLRLIDVPATFDGHDHIFDRLPSAMKKSDFDEWKTETFSEIANACKRNHGIPFWKYIRDLIAHGPELKQYVSKAIDVFVNHVCDDKDGNVTRDVAGKFGLIYAGGMLGIRYGLLPWKRSELLDAISKSYFGARALLPDDAVLLREGIKALVEKIRTLPSLSHLSEKKFPLARIGDLDGYWAGKKGVDPCLIRREVFNSIFVNTYQRDLVIRWLLRKKQITTEVAKNPGRGAEPTVKEQFPWADGKRHRSYEVRFPHKSQTTTAKRREG
jgi:putative DNA primase/helicase